jgi:hypothetical protein
VRLIQAKLEIVEILGQRRGLVAPKEHASVEEEPDIAAVFELEKEYVPFIGEFTSVPSLLHEKPDAFVTLDPGYELFLFGAHVDAQRLR